MKIMSTIQREMVRICSWYQRKVHLLKQDSSDVTQSETSWVQPTSLTIRSNKRFFWIRKRSRVRKVKLFGAYSSLSFWWQMIFITTLPSLKESSWKSSMFALKRTFLFVNFDTSLGLCLTMRDNQLRLKVSLKSLTNVSKRFKQDSQCFSARSLFVVSKF